MRGSYKFILAIALFTATYAIEMNQAMQKLQSMETAFNPKELHMNILVPHFGRTMKHRGFKHFQINGATHQADITSRLVGHHTVNGGAHKNAFVVSDDKIVSTMHSNHLLRFNTLRNRDVSLPN